MTSAPEATIHDNHIAFGMHDALAGADRAVQQKGVRVLSWRSLGAAAAGREAASQKWERRPHPELDRKKEREQTPPRRREDDRQECYWLPPAQKQCGIAKSSQDGSALRYPSP